MRPEILSTARPSALRLWSFVGLTVGGTLLAVGALMPWASIPPFDATTTNGIDVWEGWLALVAGVAALVGMLAMRLATSTGIRTAIAVVVMAGALAAAVAAAADATFAKDRFSGADQRDRLARQIAAQTGAPYEQVRDLLEREHDARFPVEARPAIWLAVAGGVIAGGGAAVSAAWARSSATASRDPRTLPGSPPPHP
jgi:hypothetical protein